MIASSFRFASRALLAAALMASSSGLLQAQAVFEQREFSVLIRGEPAGRMTVEPSRGEDAQVRTEFSFDDNGRGPRIEEIWRTDASGRPVSYEATGRTTFGAAISETFRITSDNRLTWRSRIDRGDEAASNGQLFVPLEPSPAYSAQVALALLESPRGRAPLRGGAEASLEVLQRLSIASGTGTIDLQLVSVTGIDAEPWLIWLRMAPRPSLFASLDGRVQIIARGSENAVATLLRVQTLAEDERLKRLQQRLAIPIPGTTLISNVRWFDPASGVVQGPSDIWLFDGIISTITHPGVARIRADHLVDGSGKTLLPGLIDTHAHYAADQGLQRLASGITTVRDMGGNNETLLALKARIEQGELPGPNLVLAGFLEGRSRFASRNGFVVDNLPEARRAVDWYRRNGYDTLKLYNSIRPDWVEPIIRRAKRQGMRVTGHVPAFMRAQEAVMAGFDELTHINQILLNFVGKASDDTRSLVRFTRAGEDGHSVDPESREVRTFIELLRNRGTVVDPTLVAFEAMFTQRQGEANPSFASVADHLPSQWQRELHAAEFDLEGPRLTAYRTSFERMLDMTRVMHKAGVPLITGTDSPHGLALHREIALYARAGIDPASALRAATLDAARALGQGDRRGTIERGRIADLILVAGDPTVRIDDIHRISLVIRGTLAWQPARLWRAVGVRPFTEASPVDGIVGED